MQGGCLGGTRALRCAGSGGVVGEVLEGGERGNLFRYFYLFGGRDSFLVLLLIW